VLSGSGTGGNVEWDLCLELFLVVERPLVSGGDSSCSVDLDSDCCTGSSLKVLSEI
jgi:hypothetical protein